MLNALHEAEPSGRYTRNFLIVAPGLIAYERLKDAFCGSMRPGDGTRDFTTNDYCRNQDLFIPEMYRNEVLSFIQNNIVTKEDGIGRKVTGNGIIALTNWHLFENEFDAHGDEASACDAPAIVADLLPLRPGKAAGNDLNTIDGILQSVEGHNTTLGALRRAADAEKAAARADLTLPDPEVEFGYMWGSPSAIGSRKNFSARQSFDIATLSGARRRAAAWANLFDAPTTNVSNVFSK